MDSESTYWTPFRHTSRQYWCAVYQLATIEARSKVLLMKAKAASLSMQDLTASESANHKQQRIPTLLKWAYTTFIAVLVPVYWANYGASNFLYFCDVALLLTLLTVWTKKTLFGSMAAIGILIPQMLWCLDFGSELAGLHLVGMTSYMFNSETSLFLRGLSLFHGWLPFMLVFLVIRLGYDRRAFVAWTALAITLCLIAYFLMPPAGAVLPDPKTPMNINYVFGFDDREAQTWMPAGWYLVFWITLLITLVYLPTHVFLKRFIRA